MARFNDSVAARKRRIRAEARANVLALEPHARLHAEQLMVQWAHLLPGFASSGRLLLYATAFAEEIATAELLSAVLAQGSTLLLPRVEGDRLKLFEVPDPATDLVAGCKDIPEPGPRCRPAAPTDVDWVLVPGLAFDERGYRVGRGAGHYDRLLPLLRPEAPRWALAHEAQIYDRLPIESHDQKLTGILTARRAIIPPGNSRN